MRKQAPGFEQLFDFSLHYQRRLGGVGINSPKLAYYCLPPYCIYELVSALKMPHDGARRRRTKQDTHHVWNTPNKRSNDHIFRQQFSRRSNFSTILVGSERSARGILLTERDVPGHASPHFLIRGCASTGECTQKLAKYHLKSRNKHFFYRACYKSLWIAWGHAQIISAYPLMET